MPPGATDGKNHAIPTHLRNRVTVLPPKQGATRFTARDRMAAIAELEITTADRSIVKSHRIGYFGGFFFLRALSRLEPGLSPGSD